MRFKHPPQRQKRYLFSFYTEKTELLRILIKESHGKGTTYPVEVAEPRQLLRRLRPLAGGGGMSASAAGLLAASILQNNFLPQSDYSRIFCC